MIVKCIISGGQTGADRGGLHAAGMLKIPRGGWCPAGRRAEDGVIPDWYELRETASPSYAIRTELNIRESDATVVFAGSRQSPGSRLTVQLCRTYRKPYLFIQDTMGRPIHVSAKEVRRWLAAVRPAVLNVAGSRESLCRGIQDAVTSILIRAIGGKLDADHDRQCYGPYPMIARTPGVGVFPLHRQEPGRWRSRDCAFDFVRVDRSGWIIQAVHHKRAIVAFDNSTSAWDRLGDAALALHRASYFALWHVR